jgi:hypothetical protein
MSGNLVDPLRNIAEGELSALGASFVLILICMTLLGASVDRLNIFIHWHFLLPPFQNGTAL